ncbi:MAG: patatin-like phospholipase family protein [Candidatus Omnitrophica bacterium]|nr:patatin-like phospholipase family protein [Candidatus Omnitrophota bacterium]MCA9429421.1 patatin-like phospholipase family protein [Candidatus Omnitrophota bacterium]
MIDEIRFWLERHPCSKGLDSNCIKEIGENLDLVAVETDEVIVDWHQQITSVYLILKGRIKVTLKGQQGSVAQESFLTGGGQFGILMAAQERQPPCRLVAYEPSTFLKFDFEKAIELGAKYPAFQRNLFRVAGDQVGRLMNLNKIRNQPRVVGIVHQSDSTRPLTERLLSRLSEIESKVGVFGDAPAWNPIPQTLFRPLVENGELLSVATIREQVSRWQDLDRLIYDIGSSYPFDVMCSMLKSADLVLWCVDSRNWREAIGPLKNLQETVPGWRDKIDLIWVLDGDEIAAPLAPKIRALVNRDFKVSLGKPTANAGGQLQSGLERIIHELRGVRIGLALGGGAARGMAHLGVLKALEENNIIVDMIAGTSAGAMTGTIYASGLDPDYSVKRFVEDLRPTWFFRRLPHGGHWFLLSKYRFGKFDPMLRKYLDDKRLEQLAIPMSTITVDLVGGEPVVRSEGDAVEGILESINLPVLSSPICRQGQALVDGGLVNNIPANVLVEMGCNYVIAVSVTAKLEKEFAKIRPDLVLDRYKNPSTLQTILRGYIVQNRNMNSVGVQPADFVIEPDVTEFGLTEFTRTDELAAKGEEATCLAVGQIKSSLAQLDARLFL